MKRLPLLALLFVMAGLAFSADFGLLIDQKIEAENVLFAYNYTYPPALAPWFSWNGSNGLSVFLSGLLSFKYSKYSDDIANNSGWLFIPELSRFAFSCRINRGMYFEAGRIAYNDVTGFVAGGLFDGLRFNAVTSFGGISAGAFYTGLLYKETAKITMTGSDMLRYAKPWDFDNFGDYFASRRAFAALRWDLPVGEANNLSAEVLAQFDLNDSGEKLHSQYGEVQFEFYPMNMLRITAAALFETMQNGGGDFNAAFGALARVKTDLPGGPSDWLGFTVKFTSGSTNDTFTPLNSVTQGAVFPATLTGLALIGADYSVKIINSLFVENTLRYFIRTFNDPASDGILYGGELWASLTWQPLDDIRATLGAGAFFPGFGNVYPSGTDVMWKVNAALTLSL